MLVEGSSKDGDSGRGRVEERLTETQDTGDELPQCLHTGEQALTHEEETTAPPDSPRDGN